MGYRLVIFGAAVFLLASCGQLPLSRLGGVSGGFGVQLVASNNGSRSISDPASSIEGIYFLGISVTAAQSIPGYRWERQRVNPSSSYQRDWAIFTISPGSENNTNLLLASGQTLDVTKSRTGAGNAWGCDPQLYDMQDTFRCDFITVELSTVGLLLDGTLWGGASFGTPDAFPTPTSPGLLTTRSGRKLPYWNAEIRSAEGLISPGQTKLIFARSDWFPEPVTVTLGQVNGLPSVTSSTRTLSEEQRNRVEGFLVAQNEPTSLVMTVRIVPYSLTSFALTGQSWAPVSPTFNIRFNLTNILDDATNADYLANGTFTDHKLTLRASNGLLFGLSGSF